VLGPSSSPPQAVRKKAGAKTAKRIIVSKDFFIGFGKIGGCVIESKMSL
jgi:hypothetical protein